MSTNGLLRDWRAVRKVDAHMHVPSPLSPAPGFERTGVIAAADRLGIEVMWISVPITAGRMAPIEEVRRCNDAVLDALRQYPDRFRGYCFLIPGNEDEWRGELARCLDGGMSGIKLYNQYKYSDPVLFPIAETAIEHGIPILGHAGHPMDPGTREAQPYISDASDFCALARKYPEVTLIEGHINGGGEWEWSLKQLRDCPNVVLDTSGSNMDAGTIERCVAELGADRVLFATDMSMEAGVGKVLAADLSDADREKLWHGNMTRIEGLRKV